MCKAFIFLGALVLAELAAFLMALYWEVSFYGWEHFEIEYIDWDLVWETYLDVRKATIGLAFSLGITLMFISWIFS